MADVPNLEDGIACWLMAGGAHHTVLNHDVNKRANARLGTDDGHRICPDNEETTLEKLEEELMIKDLVWKLK